MSAMKGAGHGTGQESLEVRVQREVLVVGPEDGLSTTSIPSNTIPTTTTQLPRTTNPTQTSISSQIESKTTAQSAHTPIAGQASSLISADPLPSKDPLIPGDALSKDVMQKKEMDGMGQGMQQPLTTTPESLVNIHPTAIQQSSNPPSMHSQGLDPATTDRGWALEAKHIPSPLVASLENEELWTLVRRFNKNTYGLRALPADQKVELDMHRAEDEEFSPDKLRANLERLYMTVIIGMVAAFKHIARLRSWRESTRTSYFLSVYLLGVLLNHTVSLLALFGMTMILSPKARKKAFPPAPLALVSATSGELQMPTAGTLGSHDSLTGAPEAHKGEATEQEASNLVTSFASIVIASVTGQHPSDGDKDGAASEEALPDPTNIAVAAAESKRVTMGHKPHHRHDRTKGAVQNAMWNQTKPVMSGLAAASDTWEKLANALSPTHPFPPNKHRLRLAAVLLPIFVLSLFVRAVWVVRGLELILGLVFFGQPVMDRAFHWLNVNYPNWMELLDLSNGLLKGVPTNAQLTVTLLRIGEVNKMPIPPPPLAPGPPPPEAPASEQRKNIRHIASNLNVSPAEADLMAHPPDPETPLNGPAPAEVQPAKKTSKIMNFFKGGAKVGVTGALGANSVQATIGSETAKKRLGILPSVEDALVDGPSDFKCRYHGKAGHLLISTIASSPCIAFTRESHPDKDDVAPEGVFTIALNDIRELRKLGGLGWKAKLIVGWSLGKEVADALDIVDRTGKVYSLTALPRRDELFNRLLALADQKWESY